MDSNEKTGRGAIAGPVINRAQFLRLIGGTVALGMMGGVSAALAQEGGDFVVAISSDIATLDPQMSTLDVFRHTVRSTVFEALVFINPETLEADPMLAESWEISEDGKTLTFALRSGVKWHNGDPFTAADVVYAFNRVMDEATGSPFADQLAAVTGVSAIDDLTAEITLANPVPGILTNLAAVQIVQEASIGSIDTAPVGTGPFRFSEWSPGSLIRVEKFDDYYEEGAPILDSIEWRIVPDSQARLAGLQDGSLHMVALVEGKDVIQARSVAGIEVIQTKPYILYENFNINTSRPPFDDKRVRQALSYAFDREGYTRSVWFGLARPTSNPVPPEMDIFLPGSAERFAFDLDKAAELLAEAGFTADNPLEMEILSIQGFDSLGAMALVLQDSLNRLGHNVTVRELEASVWVDRVVVNPDFDITVDNFNTGPEDPASMFASPNLAPETNVNLWNPEGYASLVSRAASETDPEKRVALYQELQGLVLEEMPQVTVAHLPLFFLGTAGADTLIIGPSGLDDYSKVAL